MLVLRVRQEFASTAVLRQLRQTCRAAFGLERATITTKKSMESTRSCTAHLNNTETLSKAVQLTFNMKSFETCTRALTGDPRILLLRDSQRVSSLQTSPPAVAAAISVPFSPR